MEDTGRAWEADRFASTLARARRALLAVVPFLLVAAAALLALLPPPPPVESLEYRLSDWRFLARNALSPPAVPPDVAVVAIDELSVARHGSWPWPRIRVAELLEKIAAGRPRGVGVDLAVSEPESAWADARLAEAYAALRGRGAEALVLELDGAAGAVPAALAGRGIARVEAAGRLRPLEARRALLPAQVITAAAVFGHVNAAPDGDGRLRREHLYVRLGGELLPSLSLQVARLALGLAPGAVAVRGGRGLRLGTTPLPADDRGRLAINYYGGERTIRRYSASALLSGDTPAEVLRDAVVFIGPTDIATYDLVATPFTATLPEVEKSATVAANILAGDLLRDAPAWANLLAVLLVGGAILLFCRGSRALVSSLALLVIAVLLVGADLALFFLGVQLALAPPLLLLIALGAYTVGIQHYTEERSARTLRAMFSSYVTERVVSQLIARPELARLGGERREVTVLFADLRGFSAIAEKSPPERVVGVLNEYLAAMTEVVFRWEGTLDKFIGDAVMVFWNAPLPQPDHAERAVRCALEMQERLARLNRSLERRGRPALAMGVGVNTGAALVGNVGAEGKKMEYTVIGDNVNLASRVEALTREHECGILITEFTLERIRPALEGNSFAGATVRSIGNVVVKGKEQTIRIFEVVPGGQAA